MILIPNFANRIPSDGDYEGNLYAWGAVAHPAALLVPERTDDTETTSFGNYIKHHLISAPFKRPPQAVTDLLMAKEITYSISVSYGMLTASASGTVLVPLDDIGERIGDNSAKFTCSASASSGTASVSVLVENDPTPGYRYNYATGNWTLPVQVTVSASDIGPDIYLGEFYSGIDRPDPFGSSYSGVNVTICGESLTLWENTSNWSGFLSSPTGSITITVTDWLPVS